MSGDAAPTGGSPEHLLQDQNRDLSRALAGKPDARLHAREAAEALAQPAASGEPVAWHCPNDPDSATAFFWRRPSNGACPNCGKKLVPVVLAAAPQPAPARVPLTDGQIDELFDADPPGAAQRRIARAIEAALGIPAKGA